MNPREKSVRAGVFVATVALLLSALAVWHLARSDREAARTRALKDAADRTANVEVAVVRALSATYALGAMVREAKGTIPNFDQIASELIAYYPGVASLQLAPDGVVSHVYPLRGNEQALGHNLLADPARTREAFLAKETGKLTLAGPFPLVQGGIGAVGRLPIYFADDAGERRFWGFATALIRFPEVLKDVRLDQLPELGYQYTLWRIHPDSGQIQIIASSLPADVALDDPVVYPLKMPNGEWHLSLTPVDGWWNGGRIVAHASIALIFSLLLGYLVQQMVELRQHRRQLETLVSERTHALAEEVDHHRQTAQRLLQLSQAVEQGPAAIVIANLEGGIEYVNQAFVDNTGYCREEVIGLNPRLLQSGKTPPGQYEAMWREVTAGRIWRGEFVNRRKDGSEYTEWATIAPIRQPDGRITHYVGVKEDISARKAVEQELRIAAISFETQEGMVVTDRFGNIQRVNRAFTAITGYAPDEVIGRNTSILKSGHHDNAFYRALWHSILEEGSWQGEIWNRRKNGEVYPEWLTITAVRGDDGEISHMVATLLDITQRKRAEDEIRNLAFYDPLTQLPNRRLLKDRLQMAVAKNARSGGSVGVLFIDLDNFKTLNDTLGHNLGDQLLQQVAQRLSGCVREIDTVARQGGDEFVVMLDNLAADASQAAAQVELVGRKILAALNAEYQLDSHRHHTSPSIGAVVAGGEVTSIDELLSRADMAMYQAKAAGKNTIRFFDPLMQAGAEARLRTERQLRSALAEEGIVLHYQPQVDADGRISGVEALARWQHPEQGLVLPDRFIPLAEEVGLILPLGRRVMEIACRQLAAWQRDPQFSPLTVAVNVSAREFHQDNFVSQVIDILQATGAPPEKLKLELTESILLKDVEDVIRKMHALRATGITFSLDDFGTGYSSLYYLKHLPLYRLKIDKSFVTNVTSSSSDAAIVGTIIALAGHMGLKVIAEGVETEAQRNFLDSSGCHSFQGYLYAHPLPVAECERFIRDFAGTNPPCRP